MGSTILGNGAFIELARNAIIRRFLESDYTHLMFIDADIAFPEHAIAGLIAGPPISAGMYRKRDVDEIYQIKLPNDVLVDRDGWIQADRIPAGFMCIERSVLEVMAERAPEVKTSNGILPWIFRTEVSHKFIGEDFCFCDDYTNLHKEGVFEEPIWVYPDLDLIHDGRLGNFHNYLCNHAKSA